MPGLFEWNYDMEIRSSVAVTTHWCEKRIKCD